MFINRHRLQEANPDNSGANANANQGDWRTAFGAEAAPVLKDFATPADFLKSYSDRSSELTTLKSAQPGDWRKTLAGDDADALKGLERFTDPKKFLQSFIEAQTKIRSGELAKPLDLSKATPEQVTEWRKANGIPLEVGDYWKGMPDGLVIGKDDQAVFDQYGAIFHQHNVPPAFAHAVAKLYYEQQDQVAKEAARVDAADRQKSIGELRNIWGNDYAANMALLDNWMEGMGAEAKALFQDATLGDGTRLMNSTKHVEWLAGIARQLNPLAHVLPGHGEGGMKSLESEIADIEKLMANQQSDYWKGPKSEAMQARYRQLITARESLKK